MKLLTLAALAALAFVAPAIAADRAQTGAEASADADAKAKPPAKEKRVCTEEQSVGSKIPRRVCRTVAQIEEERQVTKATRDRMARGEQPTAPSGGGN